MTLLVIQNMMVYQRGLASMVYKFFDSKVAPLDKKTMSGKGMGNH